MTVYTYEVKVQSVGGSNKFHIDGYQQPSLALGHDITYRFDVSDSSNAGHVFQFSTTSDGTHGGGTALGSSDGYTTSGTAGSANAYVELDVTSSTASTLYYFCGSSGHTGMGGTAVTTGAEYVSASNVALRKPILGNSDSWGHYINQNLDTIAGKLPASFVFPAGTGNNNQVILSDGSGGTSWGDVALTPEITGVTWYSDSGYSNTLSASEAINIDDATYLKVTGQNFGSSGVFGGNAYVQIINTTQSNAVVGNNQSGLTGCVTSASYQSDVEVRFTINPSGVSGITSGDTLKVKFVTGGGESLFATGYVVSADPTSVTTANSATISNTASVGSFGGTVSGGGQDSNTKLLLNFDRTGGTDIEDSSNIGGDGHKITANGNAVIKASPFGDGKSAMFFDGTNDYLSIANSSDFNFGTPSGNTNDFTIEFWARIDAYNVHNTWGRRIFSNRDSSFTEGFTFSLDATNEWIQADFKAGTNVQIPGTTSLSSGWHHVALVRVGTVYTLYIDGVQDNQVTSSSALVDSNEALLIGAHSSGNGHFSGYLDEIRIVKGTAVYTGDFTVPTSRLSATQSNQGTNIADITGTATKLLIHSNVNTEISGTSNSDSSITSSASGEHGGAWSNATAVNSNVATSVGAVYEGVPTVKLYTTTASLAWTTRKVTIPNYSSTKKYSVSIKIVASDETPNLGFWVGNSDDGTFTTVQTADTNAIPDEIYESANADRTVGEVLSTGVFTNKGADIYITFSTNQNNSKYVEVGDVSVNEWDDASSSDHTLTPTGVSQSLSHGGIATALTWPVSKKLTGSAGVYFDGATDKLTIATPSGSGLHSTLGSSNNWFWEAWIYYLGSASDDDRVIFSSRSSNVVTALVAYFDEDDDRLHFVCGGSSSWYVNAYASGSADTDFLNKWGHLLIQRNGATLEVYVNGKKKALTGDNDMGSNALDVGTTMTLGDDDAGNGDFKGYIDCVRIGAGTPTSVSGDPLFTNGGTDANTNNYVAGLPTRVYGAIKPDTIDTITLTGSVGSGQSGYVTFNNATLSTDGNNTETTSALPAGLTLNEAESQDNTATITGDLTASSGSHAINLVARVTSDGTDAEIDPNRKQAYSHTITKASGGAPVLFNARRYVGNTTGLRQINGLGFQPDLVWIKDRDGTNSHTLADSVRGGGFSLYSNLSYQNDTTANGITGFLNDGFQLGKSGTGNSNVGNNINGDNVAFISWAWKAGGAPSAGKQRVDNSSSETTLSSGTHYSYITNMKQSVNSTGGFSITQYTGGSTTSWFKHGLGDTRPDMFIIKSLGSTDNWVVWHTNLGSWANRWLNLDTAGGESTGDVMWQNQAPSADGKIYIGNTSQVNTNNSYICYAWKAVSGVSAFGTYEGNNSTSNIRSDVGFVPSLLIIKNIDNANNWMMMTNILSAGTTTTSGVNYNPDGNHRALATNDSSAESSQSYNLAKTYVDTSSGNKGFELTSANVETNGSSNTYIYMAFA